jgi:hypothetical protein
MAGTQSQRSPEADGRLNSNLETVWFIEGGYRRDKKSRARFLKFIKGEEKRADSSETLRAGQDKLAEDECHKWQAR